MKIPYSWLKKFVPALPPVHELEPLFAQLGLPLEDVVHVAAPPAGVILVSVQSVAPIPDTKLTKIVFDAGQHGEKTIASGAENAAQLSAGMMLALVTPETTLGGVTYGVRKMQGVESWGMAASEKELGLGEGNAGILVFPAQTAAAGTPLAQLWPADDVLDIEVTPNRADVLSALGLARDVAAFLKTELVETGTDESTNKTNETEGQIRVSLPERGITLERDPSRSVRVGCDHFVARAVDNVQNGPAPLWMQRRLILAGLRSIDLVVDVSNYVMLELGQPTALYNRKDVQNDHIMVTFGLRQGELVKDLFGQTHTLKGEDLLILDGHENEIPSVAEALQTNEPQLTRGVLGVAGVVGGDHGRIGEETRDVVIESAHFDPVLLRRTSTRLGLKTDAVYRFERGVDPLLAPKAADRVAYLLAEHGGGTPETGSTRVGTPKVPETITVTGQQIRALLGMEVATEEMIDILQRLGCVVESCEVESCEMETSPEPTLLVTPPSWRVDMNIWQDLAEEVARLHGFVHLPETLPTLRVHESNLTAGQASEERSLLRQTLSGLGFQEVVTYTFTSDEEAEQARSERPSVRLQNPMTKDRTGMRTALYPSLLKTAQHHPKGERALLFEIGQIFPTSGEAERLSMLMRGDFAPTTYQAGIKGNFSVFKGLIESFAARIGAHLEVRQLRGECVPAALHPGIAGEVVWNNQAIGWMGAVHPEVAATFKLKGDTFVFEAALPLPAHEWAFADPSRAPAALRDLAVVTPKDVSYGEIAELLQEAGTPLLQQIEPFDMYTGEQIGEGNRSIAVRMVYRAEKTLTDAEVEPVFTAQIAAVKRAGWSIRER